MQNIPAGAVPTIRDALPWPEVADAVGDYYTAQTDRGHDVSVWRARPDVPIDHRFWCFSHATLCHWLNGFSFGIATLQTILDDEWFRIQKKPSTGDIIIFRATDATPEYARGSILHAARIESAVQARGFRTRIRLSSKNGPQRLQIDCTPQQVERVYPEAFWYNSSCCCCCCSRSDKQYYRRINRAIGLGPFASMGYRWTG